ncbi:MAG: glycosyltransferase family 4 protein [Ardenticatenia bacterium]|nr:glycosyltransferase family 4 protein [Ardenticatenia bacterium]
MRLVFLGPFGLAPKGTMRARALPLARALARRGHEVTVIMPPWQRPEEAGRAWEDAVPGLRLVNVSLGGLRLPGLGHLIVAARMARLALALEPDVVHAFKPKAYSHLALLLLRLRRGLTGAAGPRLVLDADDWEGPGGWNDLEPYPAWQRRFFAWQERAGLGRHADAVTVASRALETLVWSLGAPPARVLYLPNAIDDAFPEASPPPTALGEGAGGSAREPTDPASPPPAHPPATLLLYTRFFEFGLDFLLEMLAALRRRHPEARLLVAGQGLFQEERRLPALAAARGLEGAIDDRGWVEPAQLAALMAGADVALYPFDDTLVNRSKSSVKLLELLAAGLPVVASAVGQNAEVIVDGQSGLLVAPGDAAAFAAAVSDLLDDADLRARLAAGAQARVREQFRWSLLAPKVLGLYRGERP